MAVEPFDGCSAATNSAALRGAIAVVKRGMCGFGDKAVNVQVSVFCQDHLMHFRALRVLCGSS